MISAPFVFSTLVFLLLVAAMIGNALLLLSQRSYKHKLPNPTTLIELKKLEQVTAEITTAAAEFNRELDRLHRSLR